MQNESGVGESKSSKGDVKKRLGGKERLKVSTRDERGLGKERGVSLHKRERKRVREKEQSLFMSIRVRGRDVFASERERERERCLYMRIK